MCLIMSAAFSSLKTASLSTSKRASLREVLKKVEMALP